MPPTGLLNRFTYRIQQSLSLTIRQRIIIAVVIQAIITAIIGLFVYISFNSVLTKLVAIEKIDDVNISILEMRKDEKNYLLYKDLDSLNELVRVGEGTQETLASSKSSVVPILQEQGRGTFAHVFDDGKVSVTAINALIKRVWKCFIIQIISASFPGLGMIAGFGKVAVIKRVRS